MTRRLNLPSYPWMACTWTKQLWPSEYQFTLFKFRIEDGLMGQGLTKTNGRGLRYVWHWPVGTRRMTSTNAANQGWLWLRWGREKPLSFGSLGKLIIGRVGLLPKLLEGRVRKLEGSGVWEVSSECWVVRFGSWGSWSGSWDARWGTFWSSSPPPPPPRQWSRGARRRPATMGIRFSKTTAGALQGWCQWGGTKLGQGSCENFVFSRKMSKRIFLEFFVPIVLFFRFMPHAVIPGSHLFVQRQEVRIGVALIIQPSSTPPCQFWFVNRFASKCFFLWIFTQRQYRGCTLLPGGNIQDAGVFRFHPRITDIQGITNTTQILLHNTQLHRFSGVFPS